MPDCSALDSKDAVALWRSRLSHESVQARVMYRGSQHRAIVRAVDLLREVEGVHVDLFIISAGFGLLKEHDSVPPYDCSFNELRKEEILLRSEMLEIPASFQLICEDDYDLIYLALGKKYLTALGSAWLAATNGLVVAFDDRFPKEHTLFLPANSQTVKAFSNAGHKIHGVVGFKGDLLRIMAEYAIETEAPRAEIMNWSVSKHLTQLFKALTDKSVFGIRTRL